MTLGPCGIWRWFAGFATLPAMKAYVGTDRLANPHAAAAAQMTSDARHVQQALAATRVPSGPGQPHSRGYGKDR